MKIIFITNHLSNYRYVYVSSHTHIRVYIYTYIMSSLLLEENSLLNFSKLQAHDADHELLHNAF